MRKIPMLLTLIFDEKGNRVIDKSVADRARFLLDRPDAVPTIKVDGTAMLLDEDGHWFARRSVKPDKKAPEGFVLAEFDENTGRSFGWEPVESSPFAKMFRRAVTGEESPGTFELVGPKINGNPENVDADTLIAHGTTTPDDVGIEFPTIAEIAATDDPIGLLNPVFEEFRSRGIEGIVWWVDNEPAVKLRVKDFFPEDDSRFRR